ncbi:alpha-galactosidase [Silvibacterium dinghuense]|uniref:alpha-galactosidase n=1 Tax=Silvibacterium dinghuense TaxID=1560006 RepID=UPI0019A3B5CA|nr:alpha-galactosidase [Silvibacterium dinghuense]GGH17168.1 alpha-galactosidase [Silvibacterium dinghuense]
MKTIWHSAICLAFASSIVITPRFSLAEPVSGASKAAQIRIDDSAHTFRLDAGDTTYAFGVNQAGALQTLYWGKRLRPADPIPAAKADNGTSSFDPPVNATPQEFVGWGGGLSIVPDLKITFPDGNRDLVLKYVDHKIDGNQLTITLKDIRRDVFVHLLYKADGETGIIARSARIENHTSQALTIEQVFAATWNLPASDDYRLTYLTGRWADEWNLQQQALRPGKVVLESRKGSTGDEVNPWFAIERGQQPDQETGDVWFGALGWSGSWQINIEEDWQERPRITGGYTPFDFSYLLAPGQSMETPTFYGGYSHTGIGGASRLLHRFELGSMVPQAPHPRVRPVLYNSWEATGFDVNEAGQEALAEKAASIGVERFVMDDGWFGERKDDHAGLGDWFVNPQKFPHGLKPLIDKVHSLGMDFGLWVEPEMVNPDSELYRNHPDWVLNFTDRPRSEGRNQLVLNLARPDVRAYVFGFLDKLLTENDIAFLKWDYNRNWSEPGWPSAPLPEQKEVYVKYVENLYSILAELRQKHPGVEIETCSGGGARVDLGILRFTDEAWPSDNTDPFDRLSIQDGFTYAYAPGLMMAWVTDSPNWMNNRSTSLEYRFLSSMQGSLGIGANLNKWNAEDFTIAKHLIDQYKAIRETVQQGSLYRLMSPENGEYSATESVAQDQHEAAVFAFLHSSSKGKPFPRLLLRGLDPDATYSIHAEDGSLADGTVERASGDYWMQHGVSVSLRGDFQAALFTLQREPGQ